MSEPAPEAPAEAVAEPVKPTETVDFWKTKARENEKRAKSNAEAADELAKIRDSQKSEAEKVADRIAKAEQELATVPAKVSDALKTHLIALHNINTEDAELFLTASDPDVLLKQVSRLVARESASDSDRRKHGNHVPREGNTSPVGDSEDRQLARQLFSTG